MISAIVRTFPTKSAEEPQIADLMSAKLGPLLSATVTPVGAFPAENPKPHQVGTGTLFAVGDDHFLVTAAHVITSINRLYGGRLCVFNLSKGDAGRDRLHPVPVGATVYRAEDETVADVAVLSLDSQTVSELTGRQFLRMSDVALRPEYGGIGWVVGYPTEYNCSLPKGVHYDPLVMASGIQDYDGAGLLNFDKKYHFVVNATRDTMRSRQTGEPIALPERFEGVSGSAIWQSWFPSRDRTESWSGTIKVVGVQTGYDRVRELVIATHWGHVAWLIWSQFPHLRAALEWHFGSVFKKSDLPNGGVTDLRSTGAKTKK